MKCRTSATTEIVGNPEIALRFLTSEIDLLGRHAVEKTYVRKLKNEKRVKMTFCWRITLYVCVEYIIHRKVDLD